MTNQDSIILADSLHNARTALNDKDVNNLIQDKKWNELLENLTTAATNIRAAATVIGAEAIRQSFDAATTDKADERKD